MRKIKYLTFMIALGVLVLGITYYFAYSGKFLNNLFWLGILLTGIPTFLILINDNIPENHKIFFLFSFGVILYTVHILPATGNFHFTDELLTYETTKLTYETGINDQTHFEISKYYSGLELLTVILKYFSNIDIFPTAKILIGIIHSMIPIYIYLFYKEISASERLSAIGAFIYSTNPLYIFFDAMFAYESLGIFLVIVLLYMMSKLYKKIPRDLDISKKLSILVIVILPAMVITHHISSFMFLLFLFLLALKNYKKLEHLSSNFKSYLFYLTILTMVLIFGWMIYIAPSAVNYLINNLTMRLNSFKLSLFGSGIKLSSSLTTSQLRNYEYWIDTYIYVPILLLFSLIGVYHIKKNRNINLFMNTLIVFGPIFYLLSLAFIPTGGSELAQRSWGFLYIGVSFYVAITLEILLSNNEFTNNKFNKFLRINNLRYIFSIFAVTIILIGGMSIGAKPIHRQPDLLDPKLVSGPGSMSTDVFSAAKWFENNFGRNNRMTGDRTTGTIFSAYSFQDVEQWHVSNLFLPETINKIVINYIKDFGIHYIIIDKRITERPSEYGTYFNKEKLFLQDYPNYSYGIKLPKKILDKFDDDDMFDSFYDNGNIKLYYIKKK